MQSARNLLPESCRILNQSRIVLVLSSRLLERGLTCDHIEENDTDGEDVCLAWLVRQLEMDFGAHIVDCAHEGL